MILRALDRRGLVAFEAALRAGEPVRLAAPACAGLPMDEVVPLCHAVDDPALARFLPPSALPGSGIRVSAVIPALRPPLAMAALAAQDVEVETLVLANGDYPDPAVPRVPWEGHGLTRQRGVERAQHPYVLLTVDDALPLGAGFVRTLVEVLEAGGYDAVYARQVPWPTADPVTRARLRAWTPPPGSAVGAAHLDHVCALHRREVLLRDPLSDVVIAEDHVWGKRHRIGYVAAAPVAHSHRRTFRGTYGRTRDLHRVLVEDGEPRTVPDVRTLVRALPGVVGRDVRGALGELLGQWVAGRGS